MATSRQEEHINILKKLLEQKEIASSLTFLEGSDTTEKAASLLKIIQGIPPQPIEDRDISHIKRALISRGAGLSSNIPETIFTEIQFNRLQHLFDDHPGFKESFLPGKTDDEIKKNIQHLQPQEFLNLFRPEEKHKELRKKALQQLTGRSDISDLQAHYKQFLEKNNKTSSDTTSSSPSTRTSTAFIETKTVENFFVNDQKRDLLNKLGVSIITFLGIEVNKGQDIILLRRKLEELEKYQQAIETQHREFRKLVPDTNLTSEEKKDLEEKRRIISHMPTKIVDLKKMIANKEKALEEKKAAASTSSSSSSSSLSKTDRTREKIKELERDLLSFDIQYNSLKEPENKEDLNEGLLTLKALRKKILENNKDFPITSSSGPRSEINKNITEMPRKINEIEDLIEKAKRAEKERIENERKAQEEKEEKIRRQEFASQEAELKKQEEQLEEKVKQLEEKFRQEDIEREKAKLEATAKRAEEEKKQREEIERKIKEEEEAKRQEEIATRERLEKEAHEAKLRAEEEKKIEEAKQKAEEEAKLREEKEKKAKEPPPFPKNPPPPLPQTAPPLPTTAPPPLPVEDKKKAPTMPDYTTLKNAKLNEVKRLLIKATLLNEEARIADIKNTDTLLSNAIKIKNQLEQKEFGEVNNDPIYVKTKQTIESTIQQLQAIREEEEKKEAIQSEIGVGHPLEDKLEDTSKETKIPLSLNKALEDYSPTLISDCKDKLDSSNRLIETAFLSAKLLRFKEGLRNEEERALCREEWKKISAYKTKIDAQANALKALQNTVDQFADLKTEIATKSELKETPLYKDMSALVDTQRKLTEKIKLFTVNQQLLNHIESIYNRYGDHDLKTGLIELEGAHIQLGSGTDRATFEEKLKNLWGKLMPDVPFPEEKKHVFSMQSNTLPDEWPSTEKLQVKSNQFVLKVARESKEEKLRRDPSELSVYTAGREPLHNGQKVDAVRLLQIGDSINIGFLMADAVSNNLAKLGGYFPKETLSNLKAFWQDYEEYPPTAEGLKKYLEEKSSLREFEHGTFTKRLAPFIETLTTYYQQHQDKFFENMIFIGKQMSDDYTRITAGKDRPVLEGSPTVRFAIKCYREAVMNLAKDDIKVLETYAYSDLQNKPTLSKEDIARTQHILLNNYKKELEENIPSGVNRKLTTENKGWLKAQLAAHYSSIAREHVILSEAKDLHPGLRL